MKKYLLLYFGANEPTPGVREAWMRWFERLGSRVIDSGNPLGACVEVGPNGTRALSADAGAAVGYSIVSAASPEDAERLLEGCPAESVRIHEAVPM